MKTRLVLLVIALFIMGSWAAADEITVELTPGEYTIEDLEDGEVVMMEGFGVAGPAGSPMLPVKVYEVALPPDVVWDSVALSVVNSNETTIPGVYDITPNPPGATWRDGELYLNWGDATNIVDGRDMDIYGSDEFWPTASADLRPPGQMRKWKFARVEFRPVRHNPVSRQLVQCDQLVVRLDFDRDESLLDPAALADTTMDDLAARKFINYHSAKKWYGLDGEARFGPLQQHFDYVIITTEAIYSNSGSKAQIDALKTHLEGLPTPYTVLIVTESDSYGDGGGGGGGAGGYGSKTGQSPNGTAEKIRKWLIDNYSNMGIYYVLLIGDPDPSGGDVPMKMCYPEGYATANEAPTDYFYADLTGDWDLDADTIFGEYNGDRGTGGVDFSVEVYVGRIPVCKAEYSTLDSIIQKVIDYETADGDLNWRLSTLMPMSMLANPSSSPGGDTSYVGHQMKVNYLTSRSFSTWEMYERRGSGCNSNYAPDQNLVANAVRVRWGANPYGMVWWSGHGVHPSGTYSVTGYSSSGNCAYGYYLFHRDDAAGYLDDDYPAFVFQGSCSNAYPSVCDNVAHSLIRHGAVTTVAASRTSYFISNYAFNYTYKFGGLGYIAYYYGDYVTQYGNYGAAVSLYSAKYDLYISTYGSYDWTWKNYMIHNLYGCPETRIYGQGNTYIRLESFEAHARGRNIVLTWETGAEIDNAGFLIYRFDGNERKQISRFIEAEGSATAGASYRFVDSNVRPGVTYQYWLVDIDTDGTWTAHGPVRARISLEPASVQIRKITRDRVSSNAAITR